MLQRLTRVTAGVFVLALITAAGCLSSEFSVTDGADAGPAPTDTGKGSSSTPTPEDDSGAPIGSDADTVIDAGDDAAVVDSGYTPPATMVTITTPSNGPFSIDSTEVTQAQYAQFLAAKAGDISGQPTPRCDFNKSYTPTGSLYDPVARPNLPITNVDWCDAKAYCAWAGKHLCSGFKGATLTYANSDKPGTSQWMYACTKAGVQSYPYGTVENTTACNINRPDGGGIQQAGSFPGCVGGFLGTYDMVGNVTEWIDACDNTACVILGGSWSFPPSGSVQCGMFTATSPVAVYGDLGFRCCKD